MAKTLPEPTRYDLTFLIHQDDIWQDASGRVWRLKKMEPDHRANLVAMLFRMGPKLQERAIARMCSGPGPSGDMACDAFDHELDRLMDMSPGAYVQSLPLVQKLIRLNGGDKLAGPDYDTSLTDPPDRDREFDFGRLLSAAFANPVPTPGRWEALALAQDTLGQPKVTKAELQRVLSRIAELLS